MTDAAFIPQTNWKTLKRLSAQFLSLMREANPDWTFEEAQRRFDLPDTNLVRELAEQAGFDLPDMLPVAMQNKLLRLMLHGCVSPPELARKTNLSVDAVGQFVREVMPKYGQGTYGAIPWGSPAQKELSMSRTKIRRISSRGQISYKGRLRGLGLEYANGICWIEEHEKTLLVHIGGGKRLEIAV